MKEKEEEAGPHGKRAKSAEEALAGLMRYAARAERSSGDALRLMRRWNVPEADRASSTNSAPAGSYNRTLSRMEAYSERGI